MFLLSLLSIRQKIFLISLVALVGLASLLLMGYSSISESNHKIEEIQKIYYPILERASFNNVQLERIEEGLNTAVTLGDTDALEKADKQFDDLLNSLQQQNKIVELQAVDVFEKKQDLSTINRLANGYFVEARKLALAMIDGSADFSTLGAKASAIANQLKELKAALQQFQDGSQKEFDELVTYVRREGVSTLTNMLVVGIAVLIIIILFTFVVTTKIRRNLYQVTKSLKEIAEGDGDLTVRVQHSGKDEIAYLVRYFNLFLEKMQTSMSDALSTIDELSQVAQQLAHASHATNAQIASQSEAIEHTTEALSEMFLSVKHIADHASDASEAAAQADKDARSGGNVVNSTVNSINELAYEVEETAKVINKLENYTNNVGDILEAIRGIADQTNLLALNAAIEAARAGEQGRGFAVVADEVRTLASRTQDSTQEIQQVLQELQTTAKSAVEAMDKGKEKAQQSVAQSSVAGESLQHITEKVAAITVVNDQIASATEQQHQTSEQIQGYVAEIQNMAKEAINSTSELDGVSQSIRDVTEKLIQITNQFKV